jgi:hypothetical protein
VAVCAKVRRAARCARTPPPLPRARAARIRRCGLSGARTPPPVLASVLMRPLMCLSLPTAPAAHPSPPSPSWLWAHSLTPPAPLSAGRHHVRHRVRDWHQDG